jgi:uncharacterized protein GlcG (DUF336 family)
MDSFFWCHEKGGDALVMDGAHSFDDRDGDPANGSRRAQAGKATRRRTVMSDITLTQAQDAVAAATEKAREINTAMDIAVVDEGANLKAFVRMDGAWRGSIDVAIKKARTARLFDMNTGDIGQLSQPGGALYNIEVSNGGLITFPGGIPLRNERGEIIGAIGVSGSSVENDHAVADAGARVVSGSFAAAAP